MKTNYSLTRRDFLKLSAAGFCGVWLASCLQQTEATPDKSYWQENYKQLMDDFDAVLNPVRDEIVELCGEQEAQAILDESRKAYEALLPQVPFIGGDDNSLTETLYMSAATLAFYRVMLSHDQPVEESGRILYRAMENLFSFNDPLASAQSRNPTGKAAQDEFRRMAKWSEQSPYPDDWKLTFVEGTPDFDFGVDYTECGIVKFYRSQQANELAPYVCLGDFPLSHALDTGLVRTTTLAHGGPCCDFRFKAGRPIQREWTPTFLEE